MRYIDNPNLSPEDLQVLQEAVGQWKRWDQIGAFARYWRPVELNPPVASARCIGDNHPGLAPDIERLTESKNPSLAFFAYLTLVWMKAACAEACRDKLKKRTFPMSEGSFCSRRGLAYVLKAANRYLLAHEEAKARLKESN